MENSEWLQGIVKRMERQVILEVRECMKIIMCQ